MLSTVLHLLSVLCTLVAVVAFSTSFVARRNILHPFREPTRLLSTRHNYNIPTGRVKVVIAGGGPAGLLAAHALLSRGKRFDVTIFDANPDPRYTPPGPRAYSLGLNIRGQYAFKYFEKQDRCTGLWDAVARRGVESDSFFLHFGKKRFQIRKPTVLAENETPDLPPTVLLQRNELCAAMCEKLIAQYGSFSRRCAIEFEQKIVDVDLKNQTVKVASASDNGETNTQEVPYDLLIGSDGVRSIVRKVLTADAMSGIQSPNKKGSQFYSEEVLLPGVFKVMVQDFPEGLENNAVHAIESTSSAKANYSLFLIPTTRNRTCVLVSTRRGNVNKADQSTLPLPLRQYTSPSAIQRDIHEKFPVFGQPSTAAVKQLLQQSPSEVKTVRCNRYHATNSNSDGGVVLLGDAAHSTGGTLGQGANSALLDVVALDQCLDEFGENNISGAITRFSERQVPEGLALWQLLQLPPKGPMGILYQISQLFWGFFTQFKSLKKIFPQPTQNLLSQSLVPFTEISRRNKFWVMLATKPFRKVVYTPERTVDQ